jgi:sugar lactone lactonase YvrE
MLLVWPLLAAQCQNMPMPPDPAAKPVISNVAGTGLAGENGDGLPAAETHLYLPQDMTMGPDGLLYIIDWNNHRIRRINNDGTVETSVGTGELGPADDGVALEQQFNHPTNVTFDRDGRMIIAAWHNSKVKRYDFDTGLVENLAGTGGRSFGGDDGPGNEAILDLPSSVVVDSVGNIIISDQANFRLRLLEPNGTIHTIAGTGEAGYNGDGGSAEEAQLNAPVGQAAPPASRIDIDARNQIYVADTGNHVIRLIDEIGRISTIVGTGEPGYGGDGGPATEARLDTPSDVEVTADGTIYIADTMNHVVRVVTPDGIINTIAGTGERGYSGDGGPADEAALDRPYGVESTANGDLYIADTHNHRIRRVTSALPPDYVPDDGDDTEVEIIPCTDEVGSICTFVGTGGNGFNGDGNDRLQTVLYWPFDIEFAPSGRTYVLDWNNHRVRELLADGTLLTVIGTDFVGDGPPDLGDLTEPGAPGTTVDLNHPTDLQELPTGELILVAWHNHKLRKLDPATGLVAVVSGRGASFAGDGGPASGALVNQPSHAVLDPDGNLFLNDQRNQRIRLFRNFATDLYDSVVQTVLGTGEPGFNGDGLAPLATQVNWPTGGNPEPTGGIAMDSGGVIYFADTNNHRVRRVVFNADFTDGEVSTIAGTGEPGDSGDGGPAVEAQINYPQDMEIGPDGNLYFADTDNNKVRMIDLTTGVITTVAGTGAEGYSGDGGPAVDAALNRPFGVAFDPNGDLYISDTFNGRIRKVKR